MSDFAGYALFELLRFRSWKPINTGGQFQESLVIPRLEKMFKDRQEIHAVGELAVFLLAWAFCVFAAWGDHQETANPNAKNALAETTGPTDTFDLIE